MNFLMKVFAVLVVVGAIAVWASGNSVTKAVETQADSSRLAASVVLAPTPEGAFDETGTILIDETQGQGGTTYILYTDSSDQGKPEVKTKRLVFASEDACAERDLPCATNQPGIALAQDQKVRVVGVVKNEFVEVSQVYRL